MEGVANLRRYRRFAPWGGVHYHPAGIRLEGGHLIPAGGATSWGSNVGCAVALNGKSSYLSEIDLSMRYGTCLVRFRWQVQPAAKTNPYAQKAPIFFSDVHGVGPKKVESMVTTLCPMSR